MTEYYSAVRKTQFWQLNGAVSSYSKWGNPDPEGQTHFHSLLNASFDSSDICTSFGKWSEQ